MAEDTRSKIIKCSTDLFYTKGYHETSLDEICEYAGITKRTFYYHIKSKDELLYEIHESYINDSIERFVNSQKRLQDHPAKEKLSEIIRVHAQIVHDYYKEITVFFNEMDSLTPESSTKIKASRKNYYRFYLAVIEDGIRSGEFKNVNPKVFCLSLLGSLNWMYKWYDPTGSLSIGEISEEYIKFILDGIIA